MASLSRHTGKVVALALAVSAVLLLLATFAHQNRSASGSIDLQTGLDLTARRFLQQAATGPAPVPALALAPGTPAGDDGDGFFPPGTFAPFPPSSPGNNPPSSTTTTNTVNGVNYPPGSTINLSSPPVVINGGNVDSPPGPPGPA